MIHSKLKTRFSISRSLGAIALVLGLTTAGYLVAQEGEVLSYNLIRQSVDSGGEMHAVGGSYELRGTIGQHDAGVSNGADYGMSAGFWFPVHPGDAHEDGIVNLADYAEFYSCSLGPDGATPTLPCRIFDIDHSGAVDIADFAVIQVAYSGP